MALVAGFAVQTAFLAVADLFHRGANLEHAAASMTNPIHSVVLIALLSLVVVAVCAPVARPWPAGRWPPAAEDCWPRAPE